MARAVDCDFFTPIVIDFETYYDKEYNLKKVTQERYIRGPEFECIGVAIDDGQTTNFFRGEEGIERIRHLASSYPERPFVSHNCTFDMGVLGLRYGICPNFIIDTMVMAKLAGLDRVLGGASLAKCSEYLYEKGVIRFQKGDEVVNMQGVHLADVGQDQWDRYSDYCIKDTIICSYLYDYLLDRVHVDELYMGSITAQMYCKPAFEIDIPLLENHLQKLEDERDNMLSALASKMGFEDNESLLKAIRSPKEFPVLLKSLEVEVPLKWSEKKEKYVPALSKTDKGFKALLEHEDPLVVELVEAKLGASSSIERTRTETFLDIASRGRAPVYLQYGAAHTLRYGGGQKTNYQNMPKRNKDPVLRRSLRAPAGHVVLATDSSQIEGRLNAFMAGDMPKVQKYIDKVDLYSDMAASIYGCSYDDMMALKVADPKEFKARRAIGKEAELGLGYGMSVAKFESRMEMTGNLQALEMSERIVNTYRSVNQMIVKFWRLCDKVLEVLYLGQEMRFGGPNGNLFYANGNGEFFGKRIPYIRLPNNTYIWYQNLRKETRDDGRENYVYDQFKGRSFEPNWIWGSKLTENLCQALAFAVLKWQALRIDLAGVPLHLNVHDEWVSVVPKEVAAKAAVVHQKCMSETPKYLPDGLLTCEVDVGLNYADLKQLQFPKN